MTSRGFTLIELLVSISIFVFMTLLVISRYGSFNQDTLLTNLAYDVALTVQTAQTYGVSVAGQSSGAYQSFTAGYGVDFNLASPTQFFLFTDTGPNGVPDGHYYAAYDSVISSYNLTQGAKISSICAGTDAAHCGTFSGSVDITFKRPNPDAILYYCDSNCYLPNSIWVNLSSPYFQVTLTSGDKSNSQIIVIRQNGQISVGS